MSDRLTGLSALGFSLSLPSCANVDVADMGVADVDVADVSVADVDVADVGVAWRIVKQISGPAVVV